MLLTPLINFKTANNNTQNRRLHHKSSLPQSMQNTALPFISPIFYSSKFNISFKADRSHAGKTKLQFQTELLKPDQYPSIKVYEEVLEAVFNKDTELTLRDIHMKVYAPLLECTTLDEAKALFPEFQTVIDARDLSEDKMFTKLKKIKHNKVEGITLEDLSLELLKRIYGQMLPVGKKENYFDINHTTLRKICTALKIKALDNGYTCACSYTDKSRTDRLSEIKSKQMAAMSDKEKDDWRDSLVDGHKNMSPEKRAAMLENQAIARQARVDRMTDEDKRNWVLMMQDAYSRKSPEQKAEARKNASKRMLKRHHDMTSKEKADWINSIIRGISGMSDEKKRQRSTRMSVAQKNNWHNNTDYIKKQSIANAANGLAWAQNPEIKEMMSRVAREEFPGVGKIISKVKRKTPLTPDEAAIYAAYFKRCAEIYPDFQRKVGNDTKRILELIKQENEEYYSPD